MEEKNFSTWKMFWFIFKGYWCSEKKWEAIGLLVGVIVLNLAMVYLLVRLNSWHNEFFSMFGGTNYSQFWPLLLEFALIAFLFIVFAANALYLQELLRLKWRIWLTKKYVGLWMQDQSYYRLQVLEKDTDNPDQRISEDVGAFSRLTLELLIGFVRKVTGLVAFSLILWNISGTLSFTFAGIAISIPGYMFWACLLYAVIGTWLAHLVGKKLIKLKYDQQKYEADFRFGMMRLRENSESIAFYKGESVELLGFKEMFGNCVSNYLKLIHRHKLLSFYTNTYDNTAVIMPILMIAPRIFNGTFHIGLFMQLTHAFASVKDGLSFFVASYSKIASLAAVIQRLGRFTQHMNEAREIVVEVNNKKAEEGNFAVRDLDVMLPNGLTLVSHCSMSLRSGERLLLTGASGCGKSTFLRTISGIWPFGKGEVANDGALMLFLPQRPYLPLGTLRRAVCYPNGSDIPDEKVHEVLRLVDLEKLIERLDEVDDYSRILSLGEQQRIAFARALLTEPRWIFLDEATSALDEKREYDMYILLHKMLPKTCIMSIGHRKTLFSLHDRELHLSKEKWILRPIEQV